MTDIPEDQQAFPHGNPEQGGELGMTLRDYFAGQYICGKCLGNPMATNHLAQRAYEYADAMLAERAITHHKDYATDDGIHGTEDTE